MKDLKRQLLQKSGKRRETFSQTTFPDYAQTEKMLHVNISNRLFAKPFILKVLHIHRFLHTSDSQPGYRETQEYLELVPVGLAWQLTGSLSGAGESSMVVTKVV